jgi:signal transduction histidine kinase
MKRSQNELAAEYLSALQDYLQGGSEVGLQRAYELGRRALAEGRGVVEMVALHNQTMVTILQEAPLGKDLSVVKKAGEFFVESMSPFEMTHRAFGEANAALRHLNETLEEETKRIAHSLHDEAGQLLAAVHISLDEVGRELPPPVRGRLQTVRGLLDEIERQLRRLSHELRPTVLDDLGLVAAIEFLAAGVSRRTNLRVAVDGFKGVRVPPIIETALYRVVQEALNNVTKHSGATDVNIGLKLAENAIRCSIRDNGVGFDPNLVSSGPDGRGLGLIGIRERLQSLGGEFQIKSAPGRGTELDISVPLEG